MATITQILTNSQDYIFALKNEVKSSRINTIKISTYGIWVGNNNEVSSLFNLLVEKGIDTTILVGTNGYKSCTSNSQCLHCLATHVRRLNNLKKVENAWSTFRWIFDTKSHIKNTVGYWGNEPAWGTIGSINLTGSGFSDNALLTYDKGIVRSIDIALQKALTLGTVPPVLPELTSYETTKQAIIELLAEKRGAIYSYNRSRELSKVSSFIYVDGKRLSALGQAYFENDEEITNAVKLWESGRSIPKRPSYSIWDN